MSRRAIILFSGGLDSTTVLAMALDQAFECHTLSFDYGQRHRAELKAAEKLSKSMGAASHKTAEIDASLFMNSSLTDPGLEVPAFVAESIEIPSTYVPARNTLFLSVALAYAESMGSNDIFIGANVVDYSNYPDCRPEYLEAFERMANLATKACVEGKKLTIHAPLLQLNKAGIIQAGVGLGVDYSQTVSCYQADSEGRACGKCDSCGFRQQGFREAGIKDPTLYQAQEKPVGL